MAAPIYALSLLKIRRTYCKDPHCVVAEGARAAKYERKIAALERKVGQLTMEVERKGGSRDASQRRELFLVTGPKLFPSVRGSPCFHVGVDHKKVR